MYPPCQAGSQLQEAMSIAHQREVTVFESAVASDPFTTLE
jgi:hypothetical protein